MRKLKPKEGEVRIRKKFLLIPRTLPIAVESETEEKRWLEFAYIREEYMMYYWYSSSDGYYRQGFAWVKICWAKEADHA